MKIELTKRVDERIKRLSAERRLNGAIILHILNEVGKHPKPADVEAMKERAAKRRAMMLKGGARIRADQAYVLEMLNEITASKKDIFRNDQEKAYVFSQLTSASRVYKADAFAKDPYLTDIKPEGLSLGTVRVLRAVTQPYEMFPCDTPARLDPNCIDFPRIGCFEEEWSAPVLTRDGKALSLLGPEIINTTAPHVRNARGDVLALGCGLGYYAYLASLKDDVRSVTVVEKDPEVATIFEEGILPGFPTKDKIRVVESDADEFLEDLDDGIYTTCFVDLWNSLYNAEPYFAVSAACSRFRDMKVSYRGEDSFMQIFASYIFTSIIAEYCRAKGTEGPDPGKLPGFSMVQYEKAQEILENVSITRPEQIDFYMSPRNLLHLLKG